MKEAHAKMYVKYQLDPKRFAMLSGSKPIIKKVELGDLIILTYDAKGKTIKNEHYAGEIQIDTV